MRPLELMNIGDRFNVSNIQLIRVTTYVSRGRDGDCTFYRHTFVVPRGGTLVYTGVKPIGVEGLHYDMRATIKRFENRWNCIRISRPKIVLTGGEQKSMDL